jgi:hypothetical protein
MTIDDIQKVFFDTEPDIQSPYGLYGHPPMWNLLEFNGITIAIRPSLTSEKIGFVWREVQGICWGFHEDGEWKRDIQHTSSTIQSFLDTVCNPVIEAGAMVLVGDPDLDQPEL